MAPTIVPNTDSTVFIVTGGNRGLGLEHVKQFLEKSKVKVIATARQPEKADELQALAKQYHDRLSIVKLDNGDEASIEVRIAQAVSQVFAGLLRGLCCTLKSTCMQAAAKEVQQQYPDGVDLILNNAGMQEPISRGIEAYVPVSDLLIFD